MNETANSQSLEQLKQAFAGLVDQELVSLIAYGDFERSLTQKEPLSILVVAHQVNLDSLHRLRTAFAKANKSLPLSPIVATPDEIGSSTDVFPITWLEMKRAYVVLLGQDVLSDLEIADEHHRIRCEQELKNLLFRMQTWFMKQEDETQLQTLFSGFWASFVRSLGASLMLVDGQWPESQEQTLVSAAKTMGLDLNSLNRGHEFFLNPAGTDKSLEKVWLETIENVAAAARFVDQLPVHCGAVEILDSSEEQ